MPKLASIDAQSYAVLTSQSLRATPLVHCKTFDPFSTTSSESQESYLTAGMLPYKHSSFLQAGVVKHNFFRPLVFYFFFLKCTKYPSEYSLFKTLSLGLSYFLNFNRYHCILPPSLSKTYWLQTQLETFSSCLIKKIIKTDRSFYFNSVN